MYGDPAERRPLRAGEQFLLPDFADTLERIAEQGAAALYRGELATRIVDHVRRAAAPWPSMTSPATASCERRPFSVEYRGHEFRSNPPPSSGGSLVALGLRALDCGEPDAEAIVAAMEAQDAVRGGAFVRGLQRGGAAKRLLSGTTHISVVDARGDAASLSASLGSGSGVVVPGTGIHLNNMLGEADLAGHARPGERLTSMMAPSLVLRAGGRGSSSVPPARRGCAARSSRWWRTSWGRGWASRRRSRRRGSTRRTASSTARTRPSRTGSRPRAEVVRFKRQNLYFGGVSAVEVLEDGRLAAAGDPRRGGAGVVVP